VDDGKGRYHEKSNAGRKSKTDEKDHKNGTLTDEGTSQGDTESTIHRKNKDDRYPEISFRAKLQDHIITKMKREGSYYIECNLIFQHILQ